MRRGQHAGAGMDAGESWVCGQAWEEVMGSPGSHRAGWSAQWAFLKGQAGERERGRNEGMISV